MTYRLKILLLTLSLICFNLLAKAQITASFIATQTNICEGIAVGFIPIINSTNTVSSVFWDFGNGIFINDPSPYGTGLVYNTSGVYTVRLVVNDVMGNTDTTTVNDFITVNPNPDINFTVTPTSGCQPVNAQIDFFTQSNVTNGWVWYWIFSSDSTCFAAPQQDTVIRTDALPFLHPFAEDGIYDVQLIAENQLECRSDTTKFDILEVFPKPTADFTYQIQADCDSTTNVAFVSTSTLPCSSSPIYNWDFGDGIGFVTTTQSNYTYEYQTSGIFTIQLIVTDGTSNGCADTTAQTITINADPTLTASAPDSSCTGGSMQFTGTSSGLVTIWAWDFGDGQTSNLQNPQHTYTIPGCYNVSLSATIDSCTFSTTLDTCLIVNPTPSATFSSFDQFETCERPHTMDFTSGVLGTFFPIYNWDFGDGTTSNLPNPIKTWNYSGYYPIALTVSTPKGCNFTTQYDTIVVDSINIAFMQSDTAGCEPLSIQFTDNSTALTNITDWFWDFGDGNTSIIQNPIHNYTSSGTYDVKLVIVTKQGCTDSLIMSNLIKIGTPPNLAFTLSDTIPCINQTISFTNNSDTSGTDWTWFNGIDTFSGFSPPDIAYTNIGVYDIWLSAGKNGCYDTLRLDDLVTVPLVNAAFYNNGDCDVNPTGVNFIDFSQGAIASWFYDFGVTTLTDDTSSLSDPSYTYPAVGIYIGVLTITDVNGCTDTDTSVINLNTPISNFGWTDDTLECIASNSPIFLTDSSINNASCRWFIPDANFILGTADSTCTPIITFDSMGTYPIRLIVRSDHGCRDTLIKYICITDLVPLPYIDTAGSTTTGPIDFTDGGVETALGNGNSCIIQIDTLTGDTTYLNMIGEVPVDCNSLVTYTGCIPLAVAFADSSYGFPDSITTWLWNFGDGNTSYEQDPTHIYTESSGLLAYVVTLTVMNKYGITRTDTLPTFIRPTQPIANFNLTRNVVCANQNTTAIDSSSGINLTYNWDFGDGDSSILQNPTFNYANEGTYEICLTVTDLNGCDSLYCDSILVINPIADFTADTTYSNCDSLTVQLTNTSINDVSWIWNFGNGSTSNLENPSVTYSGTGYYDILLISRSRSGCRDTMKLVSFIQVDGPLVTDHSVSPVDSCEDHLVAFRVQGSNIALVTINYGNGEDTSFVTATSLPLDTTIYYTYLDAGIYSPILYVEDSLNCERIWEFDTIRTTDPFASFTLDTTLGCVPLAISLDANTSQYANQYQWIAPGSVISGQGTATPNIVYQNQGYYNEITLVVTDINNCTDTISFTDTITAAGIEVGFYADNYTGCFPLTVNFTDTSTVFPDSIVSWNWRFVGTDTDTLQNPTYIYDDFVNVNNRSRLTVTSSYGCTDVRRRNILPTFPTAAFISDTLACTEQTVSFTNQSIGLGLSYNWDFGDDSTSTLQNPTHFYAYEDIFKIILTVTDQNGCIDIDTLERVIIANPVANFTSDETFIACAPDSVQFTDLSQNAISWQWKIEGVNPPNQTIQNPGVAYTRPGIYDVRLIVTSASGCKDTMAIDSMITVDGPYGTLNYATTEGCVDLTVDYVLPLTNTATVIFFNGEATEVFINPGDTLFYSYTYTQRGTYTPTVFIQDSSGCQRILTNGSVTVTDPEPVFTISPDTSCLPFTAAITSNTSLDMSSFQWLYSSGTISNPNSTTPTFSISDTGYHAISLVVTDVYGCKDTTTHTVLGTDIFEEAGASTTDGCRPLTVQFSDLATVFPDSIISWLWVFGDGNGVSTNKNPTYTYQNIGIYTPTLTVMNSYGCTKQITLPQIETTFPSVSYTPSLTYACTGQNILFDNQSSGQALTYSWDFDNGTTVTTEDPTYAFPMEGTYNVCLTTTDINSCDSTYCEIITIADPLANFTVDTVYRSCPPATFQFTDLSANAVTWSWTFGDGGTSTNQNPSYTYIATGIYDVQLIVTSASGCIDTLFRPTYIEVGGPVGNFAFTPNQGCANLAATFVGTLTNNSVAQYHWDFGNGDSTIHVLNTPIDSFEYIYTASGTFFPTLTFEDSTGCMFFVELDSIEVDTLQFDFFANDTLLCEVGSFTFTPFIASSSPIDSVVWNFGGADVTTSNLMMPTIPYSTVGDFDVTLTVYSRHCTKTITKTQYIKIAPIPNSGFATVPTVGCNPTTVFFTDTTDIFSGNVVSWAWNFGDGGVDSTQNSGHSYQTADTFDIQLITVSEYGCADSVTYANLIIINPIPHPAFVLDTFACTEQAVFFVNNSTGNNITYNWDFGDGNASTDFEPVHQYANEGIFTVCLTVIDINGCDSTTCQTLVIANPVAAFTSNVQYLGCPPDSIPFIDNSINAIAWNWSFGDDSISTEQNPTHTYAATGFYDVQLIVTGASGCFDTLLQINYIEVGGPVGDFAFTPKQGCANVTATFVGTLTNNSVTQYHWNFGNGDSITRVSNMPIDSFEYIYTTSGTYFPTLTFEDSTGCRFFVELDSIEVDTLQFNFFATDTVFCETANITFNPYIASSSPIDSVLWTFNGAVVTTSTLLIPTIPYDTIGDFDVTLTVFSNHCSKTITKTQYMKAAPIPTSYFTTATNPFCSQQTISFLDAHSIFSGSVVDWQWDFDDLTTSAAQNPMHTYADSGFYNINLLVTSEYGCTNDTTITVYINKTPAPIMTPAPILCIGEVFTLTASGGDTYAWYNGLNLICDTCISIDVAPVLTTNYTLIATSNAGCSDTISQTVSVLPYAIPPLVVSNDTIICKGDVIQLFASGGYDIVQYQWDVNVPGLSCYTNCTNPFASPDVTTTYYVTLTWDGGCSKTDSITVTVIDDASPILGVDRTVCLGESVQLGVSTGSNAIWTPSEGLSCKFCDNPIASPLITTTYAVEATTPNGCIIRDTMTVNVQTPDMINAGDDVTICLGTAIPLEGVGIGTVTWSPAATLSNANILNPTASPIATTDYILIVQNDLCIQTDTVTITIADKVVINIADLDICEGETVEIDVQGYADSYIYTPENGVLTVNPTLIQPTETTTYTVIGSIPSCESDTTVFTITVNPIPDIGLLPSMVVFKNSTTPLPIDNPNSQYMHTWTPSTQLSCPDCFDPFFVADTTFEAMTIYVDLLTQEGCSFTDSIVVTLTESCGSNMVQLPSAFTPNGDGQNDIFRVRGLGLADIEIFRVYNRWGEQMFSTSLINKGWDGTYKQQPVEQGVYHYYVQAICPLTGEILTFKGDVFLHF